MTKRMLVDATHPEETRVVVVSGNRLEEFDFETSSKQQLKGNIYLAKVTRVEPSLQAAFVEYGGNRHGFLAFSEIHPDYYRIPIADREALMAEEARRRPRDEEDFGGPEEDEDEEPGEESARPRGTTEEAGAADAEPDADSEEDEAAAAEPDDAGLPVGRHETGGEPAEAFSPPGVEEAPILPGGRDDAGAAAAEDPADAERDERPPHAVALTAERPERVTDAVGAPAEETVERAEAEDWRDRGAGDLEDVEPGEAGPAEEDEPDREGGEEAEEAEAEGIEARRIEHVEAVGGGMPAAGGVPPGEADRAVALEPDRIETVGGNDGVEEAQPVTPRRPLRSYKIQEVIKRRQIMLVQVTKEERGNKGAALTTYLSLAGRYCVLMPNSPRGGGVSRKISSPKDRKRMKAILEDLAVPEGMAVILRTAGLERTKAEIKRDFDYLLRLWDSIRQITLESTAPCLIHEEANLIKRAIRDLYSKDIDEVLVAGEDGYRTAKDFMRMLMPSHAKKVQHYRESVPLFHRYQVESQIEAMHSPDLQLKSGGYIVINPTEALVAIDVNSGRATRERNIEETAYKTNMEAAEEIARQLRLRDLAGLIVIDFIDMEEERHIVAVERRLKEAMRSDRARIQLGRISPFGLLELSRQRLRPSFQETHFETCPQCRGRGMVRSIGSAALHVLRAVEEEGIRRRSSEITVSVPTDLALYIFNQKRDVLAEIEERYSFRVLLVRDDSLGGLDLRIERSRGRSEAEGPEPSIDTARLMAETDAALAAEAAAEEEEEEAEAEAEAEAAADSEGTGGGKRRKRPRRRRKGEEAYEAAEAAPEPAAEPQAADAEPDEAGGAAAQGEDKPKKKRRRGKRGGRRRAGNGEEAGVETPAAAAAPAVEPAVPPPAGGDELAPEPAFLPSPFGDEEIAAEVFPPPAEAGPPPAPPEQVPAEQALPVPDAAEPAAAEAPVPPAAAEPPVPGTGAAAPEPEPVSAGPEPSVEAPAVPEAGGEAAAPEPAPPTEAPVAEPFPAEPPAGAPPLPEAGAPEAREPAPPASEEPVGPAAAPEEDVAPVPREPAPAASAEAEPPVPADRPEREDATEPDGEERQQRNAAYEVVNQPPDKPRRGWWQRLVQS